MSTMYASLFREEHLKNLILLATPIDFAPDHPDLMTEAFRQWIRGFYQKNTPPKVETEFRGQRVGLSNIDCPLLNIAGSKDFICPLGQAEATMDLTSSQDKEFAVFNARREGLMAGPVAKKELWPKVTSWLETRSK